MSKLEPVNQAIELWKIRFPDGEANLISSDKFTKADLPLLWIDKTNDEIDAQLSGALKIRVSLLKAKMGLLNTLTQNASIRE